MEQNAGMEAAFIAAVTLLSVTIIGLVIYILWLKRNGKTLCVCVCVCVGGGGGGGGGGEDFRIEIPRLEPFKIL